jgi:hypothetical protein
MVEPVAGTNNQGRPPPGTSSGPDYVAVIRIHVVSRRGEAAFSQNNAFAPATEFD